MSYRNMTLSEKKRIYRKIGAVVAAAAILCVMLVIALRPADGGQADGRTTTQPVEGMIEVDGVKYVPKKNIEIVHEGRELHHCAGNSDRYFDRIAQRETYICFLRKVEEPDKPYYTIEVEPGGTIRQHRGMCDEEPEIDEVRPFLREWQKEIRRRMSREDHELAAASKVKREENIKELQDENNTRVLEGLMEDFMEAAG